MSQDSIHYRCEYVHLFGPISHERKLFNSPCARQPLRATPFSLQPTASLPNRIVCAVQVCSSLSTICFFHSVDPRSVHVAVAFAFFFIECAHARIYADIYCIFQQTRSERWRFSPLAQTDAERHSSVRLTIRVASLRVLRERIVHSVYINISKDTCSIPRKLVEKSETENGRETTTKRTNVGKFVGNAHTTRAHAVWA